MIQSPTVAALKPQIAPLRRGRLSAAVERSKTPRTQCSHVRGHKKNTSTSGGLTGTRSYVPGTKVVDLLSDHEPSIALPDLASTITGRSSVNASEKRAASTAPASLDDSASILRRLEVRKQMIKDYETKVKKGEFKDYGKFAKSFGRKVEYILDMQSGRRAPRRPSVNPPNAKSMATILPLGSRKRPAGRVFATRKRPCGATMPKNASELSGRSVEVLDKPAETLGTLRTEAIRNRHERDKDSQDVLTEASNKEKDDFRTDLFSHKTKHDLINWLNTIRS